MSKELEIMEEEREWLVEQDYADCYIKECDLVIKALERLESIDNAEPSEALDDLEKVNDYLSDVYDYKEIKEELRKDIENIKQALLKAEKEHKALEAIKEYFIFKFDKEEDLGGNVWGLLVSIQSKEDEGTWDTTASANLAGYEEEFNLLKEVLGE